MLWYNVMWQVIIFIFVKFPQCKTGSEFHCPGPQNPGHVSVGRWGVPPLIGWGSSFQGEALVLFVWALHGPFGSWIHSQKVPGIEMEMKRGLCSLTHSTGLYHLETGNSWSTWHDWQINFTSNANWDWFFSGCLESCVKKTSEDASQLTRECLPQSATFAVDMGKGICCVCGLPEQRCACPASGMGTK